MSDDWDPGLPPEYDGDEGVDATLEEELRALFAHTRAPREFRSRLKAELLGQSEPYVLVGGDTGPGLWSHRALTPFRVIAAHPRVSTAVSAALAIAAAALFSLMNQGFLSAFTPHSTNRAATSTPTATYTATARPTSTPTPVPTAQPTATPRPIVVAPTVAPTNTPAPTLPPPSATPTLRPIIVPTATPRPAPPPTRTPKRHHSTPTVPPPTIAPTNTPVPTLAPTATALPVAPTAPPTIARPTTPPTSVPAPTATPTPRPTATPPAATATPRPTRTPQPTSTPAPTATTRPSTPATPGHTTPGRTHKHGHGHGGALPPLPIRFVTPLPPSATPTPRPTTIPAPTATPRPTATATPRPTSTPTPRPTSTPTATATPTPRGHPVINPLALMSLPWPNADNGVLSSPLNGALTGAQQPNSYQVPHDWMLPAVPATLPVYPITHTAVITTDALAIARQLGVQSVLKDPVVEVDGSVVSTVLLDNQIYVLTVRPGYDTPWFTLQAMEPAPADLMLSQVQVQATAWLTSHHLAHADLRVLTIASGGVDFGQSIGGIALLGHVAVHLDFDGHGVLRDLSYAYVPTLSAIDWPSESPAVAASNALASGYQGLYQGPAADQATGPAAVTALSLSYVGVHGGVRRDYLEPIYMFTGTVPTAGGAQPFSLYIPALQLVTSSSTATPVAGQGQ